MQAVGQTRKWRGGIASNRPRTTHETKHAMIMERITISHCPLTTTGLRTLVSGDANAGTALIILNCFWT